MIDYDKYNLVYDADNMYTIGYKKEVVKMLKDNLIDYIERDFPKDVIEDELERLTIVRDSKYENDDLIRLEGNDEGKSHNPKEKIAKVSVLVPYHNGFSGKDVLKYLTN